MDLFIPICRYQVTYEKGMGRPYSKFDRLVLEAVASGADSIPKLNQIFCLPVQRLLIEALVTLARAGWVSINTVEGGFAVTDAGRRALASHETPPFTLLESYSDIVLLDGFSGALATQKDVNFISTSELTGNEVRLPYRITHGRLDAGQVKQLLPRAPGEWIRWVGTPKQLSQGRHGHCIRLNEQTGELLFVPAIWRTQLLPLLNEWLEQGGRTVKRPIWAQQKSQSPDAKESSPSGVYDEVLHPNDLLLTKQQHFEKLRESLENASEFVLIASAFLDTSAIEGELAKLIQAALERGVYVSLLWGYAAGHGDYSTQNALKWLRQFRKTCGPAGSRLRFNPAPTDSHAKMLLFDAKGAIRACVGSFNWLSTALTINGPDQPGNNISVQVCQPGLVADLCESAAALWMTSRGGDTTAAPEHLRQVMVKLEEQNASLPKPVEQSSAQSNPTKIRVVRDIEHEHWLRDWLLSDTNFIVTSHQLGEIAYTRLKSLEYASAACPKKRQILIAYGTAQTDLASQTAGALVTACGCGLVHAPGLHAKVLGDAHRALVSSYNFLSADPFGHARRSRELGLLIEGGPIPSLLHATIANRLSLDPELGKRT